MLSCRNTLSRRSKSWLILSTLAGASLYGCGGGSSSPPPPPPPVSTITSVTVSPGTASLVVKATQQFTATVQGTGSFSTAVGWYVNGLQGGNSTLGTITAGGTAGLLIYSIANVSSPVLVSQYKLSSAVGDIALDGNLAFLAAAESGLVILDIANPAAPVLVSETLVDAISCAASCLNPVATAVAVNGGLVYVGSSGNMYGKVFAFDYRVSAHPRLVSTMSYGGALDEAVYNFAFYQSRMFVGEASSSSPTGNRYLPAAQRHQSLLPEFFKWERRFSPGRLQDSLVDPSQDQVCSRTGALKSPKQRIGWSGESDRGSWQSGPSTNVRH